MTQSPSYVGRFAPSPSGPLHFGSLVAAVGSYLQAKANGGEWLVRIEDIDPPREMPGAADQILVTLEAHGLLWDRDVMWQSQRSEHYDELLIALFKRGFCYTCECTRKAWQRRQGECPCRLAKVELGSIRFLPSADFATFADVLQGLVEVDTALVTEPFVVKRRDGLYAYQLAVVADDIAQGITEVIRGADLLDTTPWQLDLFRALGAQPPRYGHLPVASTEMGKKLSKQNHAAGLDNRAAPANLRQALHFLKFDIQDLPRDLTPAQLLNWAVEHWRTDAIEGIREILL